MVSEWIKKRNLANCVLVLILVLVEDGLGVHSAKLFIFMVEKVLILVLVEDGLGVNRRATYQESRTVS